MVGISDGIPESYPQLQNASNSLFRPEPLGAVGAVRMAPNDSKCGVLHLPFGVVSDLEESIRSDPEFLLNLRTTSRSVRFLAYANFYQWMNQNTMRNELPKLLFGVVLLTPANRRCQKMCFHVSLSYICTPYHPRRVGRRFSFKCLIFIIAVARFAHCASGSYPALCWVLPLLVFSPLNASIRHHREVAFFRRFFFIACRTVSVKVSTSYQYITNVRHYWAQPGPGGWAGKIGRQWAIHYCRQQKLDLRVLGPPSWAKLFVVGDIVAFDVDKVYRLRADGMHIPASRLKGMDVR